jgi:ribosome-binding ATPase YchF (GTP1/OBG family)
MKVGLVGFSGSGKSTLFQWLTGVVPDPSRIQQGQTGVAPVPDDRLAKMVLKFKPKKTRYADIAFLDTPGLLLGERKDNPRRLGIIREADGLLIVLDGFSATNLAQQLLQFREEIAFADLEIILNRIDKLGANLKKARPQKERELDEAELALLKRIQKVLEESKSPHTLGLRPDEEKQIRSFQLLTLKNELVLVNRGDSNFNDPISPDLLALTSHAIAAPVKLEAELAELDEESRNAFMADLGLTGSSRDEVVRKIFYSMDRIVFFTVGEDECRSWAIDKHCTAVDGAGAIHTDLARGFIRAEVIGYDDFVKAAYEEKNAKAAGTFRLESKEYIVQDGDIMHIRASV